MNFKTIVICALLATGTTVIVSLSGCNKVIKQDSSMRQKQAIPNNEKVETFQELGFFGAIKEDKWDDFLQAVQTNISNSRKEQGNLAFSLYQPEDSKLQPIWFERFNNKQAHNHHKEQGYFKSAITVIQKSLKGEANSITLKEVKEIPATVPILPDKPKTTRHVIVLFDVKPEKRQFFIDAMAQVAPLSRKSQGNLEFNLYQYANDINKFVLMEGWQSKADHEAQLKQDYIKMLNNVTKGFFVTDPMDTRWLVKDISQQ